MHTYLFRLFFLSLSILLFQTTFINGSEFNEKRKFYHAETAEYFTQLEYLKKNEKWQEIIDLAEKTLNKCLQNNYLTEQFEITDQLVSTYFRLGEYEKAKKYAEELVLLGNNLNQPNLVANSYYKLSATIRGLANSEKNLEHQKKLFNKAKRLAKEALDTCEKECKDDLLKAKILFNLAAAESDDPNGDYLYAIEMYEMAIQHFENFSDEDYLKRTKIRLAKANLLIGKTDITRKIIEECKKSFLEERTCMHLNYLEAQLLISENHLGEALNIAMKGKETASRLQASIDYKRFVELIDQMMNFQKL